MDKKYIYILIRLNYLHTEIWKCQIYNRKYLPNALIPIRIYVIRFAIKNICTNKFHTWIFYTKISFFTCTKRSKGVESDPINRKQTLLLNFDILCHVSDDVEDLCGLICAFLLFLIAFLNLVLFGPCWAILRGGLTWKN